jgi:hypothetical protein
MLTLCKIIFAVLREVRQYCKTLPRDEILNTLWEIASMNFFDKNIVITDNINEIEDYVHEDNHLLISQIMIGEVH